MDRKRFDEHVHYSMYGGKGGAPKPKEWYTKEEHAQGYHFCWDWDGLFIGPDAPEFKSCTCLGPWNNKDL